MHAKSLQLCPTLCDFMDNVSCRLLYPWDFPGKNTGVLPFPTPVILYRKDIVSC